MENRAYAPYITVIALLLVTSFALALTVDVTMSDQAGVKSELPNRVGNWTCSGAPYHCLEDETHPSIMVMDPSAPSACPACGGKISQMTRTEAELLPSDTVLVRKNYTNQAGRGFTVSIVLSGRERASIHRPEVCLAGGGNDIVNQSILPVPLAGRAPLRVKILDLTHRDMASGALPRTTRFFYAYWFAGRGRETPEHLQRMWWMASDRILHNVAHRWAYIAVTGRADDAGDYLQEAESFIQQLHPQLVLTENPPAALPE